MEPVANRSNKIRMAAFAFLLYSTIGNETGQARPLPRFLPGGAEIVSRAA